MKRDVNLFLNDIVAACLDIIDFVGDMDYDTFVQDKKTCSAVIRQFEIIGEAAKNVSDAIKEQYPKVAWKDIAGMRDRLIHGYFGIDLHLVWDTITIKIPELESSIRKILDDLKDQK